MVNDYNIKWLPFVLILLSAVVFCIMGVSVQCLFLMVGGCVKRNIRFILEGPCLIIVGNWNGKVSLLL